MAFNTSDPKVQKALLVMLVLVGGCYGYWMYILGPKREEVAKAKDQYTAMAQAVKSAQAVATAGDTAALRQELIKRETELQLAQQLLPSSENLPGLLRSITRNGELNNLDFALFEPQAPIQHEFYQERPFKVKIRGGFHETARFLSDVAGMEQIVKPTSLSLVRDMRPDSPEGETLTADVVLTTYLLIAAPPKTANEQQKGQK